MGAARACMRSGVLERLDSGVDSALNSELLIDIVRTK